MAQLADAGAACITHLGNGMPNQVHRHHNPLLAGLGEERLAALVIADGHHLPAHVVKTIFAVKTAKRLIVTSDASPLAGCKPGTYQTLSNRVVLKPDGLLYNPEKKCLFGSSFTMLECINWLTRQNLLTEQELLQVSFTNPLKLLNIPAKAIRSDAVVTLDKRSKQFKISKKDKAKR